MARNRLYNRRSNRKGNIGGIKTMSEEEKLNLIIEDFIKKNWFYFDEETKTKVVNVKNLIEYIEYLKEN